MTAKNMKKTSLIAYAMMVVLGIAALIVYLNNNSYISTAPTAKDEFFQSYIAHADAIIWLTIGSVCCAALTIVLNYFGDQSKTILRLVSDVVRVAAPALMAVALAFFLSDRVDGFGYIYGSNLAQGKDDAFTAGTQATIAVVLFALTWLVGIVAAFMGTRNKA